MLLAVQVKEAQSFMEKKLVPKVKAAGVDYKIEICHFNTDTSALGEVWPLNGYHSIPQVHVQDMCMPSSGEKPTEAASTTQCMHYRVLRALVHQSICLV